MKHERSFIKHMSARYLKVQMHVICDSLYPTQIKKKK